MDTMTIVTWATIATLGINVFLASIVVFFERRNPASTWAWLLVLFFIPIFGFVIYIIFGKDGKQEKVFAQKAVYDYETYYEYIMKGQKYKMEIEKQTYAIEHRQDIVQCPYLNDLVYLHINSGSWVTFNNSVTCYTNGNDKFDDLISDIRNAKKYIHLEYYIIRNDDLGNRIISELTKAASKGVEVRLLYDGMGNTKLKSSFFKDLIDAGGYAVPFLPPFIVRLNFRNHRKVAVIDGEVGYIGGLNIGDEYLGLVKEYGPWRDTHVRISGDAIDQLQLRFMMDWNFTSYHAKIPFEEMYFPERRIFDGVKMQIVSSGPDTKWQNIRNGYFKMMTEAERNIFITTPYFVPDDGVLLALKVAALSGIDVRIIIPGNPDHPFVYWASMSYLGELLETGVRCYQYENGFIHSKTIFVDGIISSIGTANMDVRSFALNFEANAFIYDRDITEKNQADFINDLKNCTEITKEWYAVRSVSFKIKEAVSRLISPML